MYNDTKIFGDGVISEGKYNKIKVMGNSTRFHNKLNIDFFTTLGDCNLDDDSIIGLAKIKGDLKAKKDLEVREDLNVSGEVVEYTGKITIDKNSKVVEEVCLKN